MKVLRTPEDRFQNIPDFPYAPRYMDVQSGDGAMVRMAYVEAGDPAGQPILLLHGEPSWSFLYRKMIPVFAAAGYRVLAPDLIGFGRSDKPASPSDYSYLRHVEWVTDWVQKLDLKNVVLFCQDWGGLIGLRVVAENSERFARVVAGNTFMPTGDQPLGGAFEKWKKYAMESPEFHIGGIIKGGTARGITPELIAAYDAPFPDETFMAGARVFPTLVPSKPDDPAAPANRAAWEKLMQWEKPFLTTFGDSDPITRGADGMIQALVPGTKGQPHTTIEQAGHFLQEDQGEKIANYIVAWLRAASV
jgi:haloalkane dehalogenase